MTNFLFPFSLSEVVIWLSKFTLSGRFLGIFLFGVEHSGGSASELGDLNDLRGVTEEGFELL